MSIEKTHVKDVYENIAPHFANTRVYKWSWVIEFLDSLKDNSIVYDLGCGNGRNMNYGNLKFIGIDNCDNFITCTEASHPVPCKAGVEGTKKVVEVLKGAGENTLCVVCVSGGGSALLVHPAEGLSLQDLQETNKILLECGATIQEINAFRKHLSS